MQTVNAADYPKQSNKLDSESCLFGAPFSYEQNFEPYLSTQSRCSMTQFGHRTGEIGKIASFSSSFQSWSIQMDKNHFHSPFLDSLSPGSFAFSGNAARHTQLIYIIAEAAFMSYELRLV